MTADDVYEEVKRLRAELAARWPDTDAAATNGEEPKRRRLTKDDVLASHLAAMMRPSPEHHSVLLKTNAKGEVQIEVTVRAAVGTDFETPAQAFAEASRIYLQARDTLALAGITVEPSKAISDGGQA